ncbi:uncharacterized protein TNCV_3521311 [Trichonephila clavipes]|nr:uncharacterized protein TNCV_3521311 [Trichonephila clavipes]
MTECLHISAQMCEVYWIQHIQGDGFGGVVLVNWPARSPDLSCLDFFLWGHMKSCLRKPRRLRRGPGCEDCRRSKRNPGDAQGIC